MLGCNELLMSKGVTTIKVLRENFIKKYQIHPDYFYQTQKQLLQQDIFNDKQMFYPKQFQRKNHQQRNAQFVNIKKPNDVFKQYSSMKLPSNPQKDKKLKITPKSITPNLRQRYDKIDLLNQYNSIPCQPSFIKTQKLKRKVVSARQSKRPLPRYSAYIMKPCNVMPAKMEVRPQSACARSKSTDLNKYMGFGLKKQQVSQKVSIKIKKPENQVLPWQTQYQQL